MKNSKFDSKLVNFDLYSDSHPNKIKIENAWVVSSIDLNYKNFDVTKLKEKYKHLQNVPIPSLNPGDVSLIIGADFPELLIQFDFRLGDPCQPCAVKTKLGWVVMGGKNKTNQLNSNNINIDTSFDLEQFWNLENYGTVKKNDPVLLTKDEKRKYNSFKRRTV